MPLSKLYEKPRSATKVRSFPVKVSTMDADMKFDDIEVQYLVFHENIQFDVFWVLKNCYSGRPALFAASYRMV